MTVDKIRSESGKILILLPGLDFAFDTEADT